MQLYVQPLIIYLLVHLLPIIRLHRSARVIFFLSRPSLYPHRGRPSFADGDESHAARNWGWGHGLERGRALRLQFIFLFLPSIRERMPSFHVRLLSSSHRDTKEGGLCTGDRYSIVQYCTWSGPLAALCIVASYVWDERYSLVSLPRIAAIAHSRAESVLLC